jgi:hypothetical protein
MGYVYRDPARCSPQRLAELHLADLREELRPGRDWDGLPGPDANRLRGAARRASFARLREAGLGVKEARSELGVSERQAREYERARRAGHRQEAAG